MPLLRRRSGPDAVLTGDLAGEDPQVAAAREALRAGQWEPAADLLSATVAEPDRRSVLLGELSELAVGPAPWLDAWHRARPGDPGPALVAADAAVQRAWEARGAGRADETADSAFAAFFALLDEAAPLAHAAVQVAPRDPLPWLVLLRLGMGQQDGREVLDDRWEELVDRDPAHRAGHNARLQTISDKWYGSHEEMYAFARAVREPHWAPVFPLQAHVEFALQEQHEGTMKDPVAFWRSAEVQADLDRALAWAADVPPYSYLLHDLSVVAFGLAAAERWADLAVVLDRTGPRNYEYPWYYLRSSGKAFTRAVRSAADARG
jgi:hypothetical protein